MSIDSLLILLSQLVFPLLGIVTVIDYLRHRDRTRRDIALMFGSLAIPIGFTLVNTISPLPEWAATVGAAPLLAQPYLLLRLIQHLQPVPRWLQRFAQVGLVFFLIIVLFFLSDTSPAEPFAGLGLVVYFVILNGYAVFAFIRGALVTSGVVRQRMRFAAAGSGMLALVLGIAGLGILVPTLQSLLETLTLLGLAISALAFYIGFVPPGALRRMWQFSELRDFLIGITNLPGDSPARVTTAFSKLGQAANQAVGGMVSVILERGPDGSSWQVVCSSNHQDVDVIHINTDSVVQQAWETNTARWVRPSTTFTEADRHLLDTFDATAFIVVPISTSSGQFLGMLLVFMKSASLFPNDDLELLHLLAQQGATFLENIQLVEQLQNYSEGLEQKVEERATELRKTEARFTRVLDTTAEAVITIDSTQKIILFNQSAEQVFGYTAEEMLGQSLNMLLPPAVIERHPHFIRDFSDGLDIARGMGERRGALSAKRKDGTIFPIEASISKLTEDDNVILTVFIRDITEQERAQAALLESENRYHGIIDNMLEGFQILGFDWRYLYLNDAAARYGRKEKESLLGHTVMEAYPGVEESEMFAAMRECMEERTLQLAEFEFFYPDGNKAWFQFSIQPVPEGIFILSLDITERKQAEEALLHINEELEQRVNARTAQLQATNEELEAFSYSVSHDLRAPLRALDGFSQALLEDYEDKLDKEGEEYLTLIRMESQRMGQLIDDLLDLSKLTQADFNREQVHLSEMVREIVRELQQRNPERAVEFILTEDITICADLNLMQIALQNLLENAWKYTNQNPKAVIEFGVKNIDAEEPRYFIRDNGAGFDMKYAHKLFGAFQRLHGMNEFEGSGIGLATVQRIINRHGGTVNGHGEVGEGATFFFTVGQGTCE